MSAVHPRSRGEHAVRVGETTEVSGSSPLARGTRGHHPEQRAGQRFIPARAGNTSPARRGTSGTSVHPRSRGEHRHARGNRLLVRGSSPLARGTPVLKCSRRHVPRFIPARAGNTGARCHPSRSPSVHPRSRGEHAAACAATSPPIGSSPLARGTPPCREPPDLLHRFIPARAGNTRPTSTRSRWSPVHPRSRGEHLVASATALSPTGSSPLARGTRASGGVGDDADRFIPARAGNTPSPAPSPAAPPVHPRSRGEHRRNAAALRRSIGSSPLARGTRQRPGPQHPVHRFIPARAGNTFSPSSSSSPPPVHPRSRGEHVHSTPETSYLGGSSPLARGTPWMRSRGCNRSRFIPARAGNTPRTSSTRSRRTVHPRSRGEHPIIPPRHGQWGGSSPLARGTQCHLRPTRPTLRFIPARAGNTSCRRTFPTARTVHPRSRGEHVVGRHLGDHFNRFIPARAGNTGSGCPLRCSTSVHPRSRGEHEFDAVPTKLMPGSSPLARGTPQCSDRRRPGHRFIPARAGNTWHGPAPARARPVHPRSRGEHLPANWPSLSRIGSSPLARGTLATSGQPNARPRFIPARAGNTPGFGDAPPPYPVHPRSRGEHTPAGVSTGAVTGSSPLARGTPSQHRRPPRRMRFIPARAGNTRSRRR